jgi:hypothetical protein
MEDGDEPVNVVEAVIQRRRRNAQNIRFTLVDNNTTRLNERLHAVQQPGVQQDAELGASLGGVEGRDDLVGRLATLVPQQSRFQVAGEADAALTEGVHGGQAEDVERSQRRGHVQRGRIGQLEARSAGDGDEFVLHGEATGLVAAPPAAETGSVGQLRLACFVLIAGTARLPIARARSIRFGGGGASFDLSMSLVHEETTDNTGSAIHVLVVAPCGEVDVPVVQLQWHITHCVRQIPADRDAVGMTVASYELNIEKLSRVELDSGQQDKGGCSGVLRYDGEDVLGRDVGRGG